MDGPGQAVSINKALQKLMKDPVLKQDRPGRAHCLRMEGIFRFAAADIRRRDRVCLAVLLGKGADTPGSVLARDLNRQGNRHACVIRIQLRQKRAGIVVHEVPFRILLEGRRLLLEGSAAFLQGGRQRAGAPRRGGGCDLCYNVHFF